MNLFLRVSSIVLTLLVFLSFGMFIGEKRIATTTHSSESYRFQPLSDGKAFDTKTGRYCIPGITPPSGLSLDGSFPSCAELSRQ